MRELQPLPGTELRHQRWESTSLTIAPIPLTVCVIRCFYKLIYNLKTLNLPIVIAGEFDELRFVMPPVMIIKLKIEDPKILFDPTFRECRDIILRCFSEIIASGEGLSRIECELFPQMKGQRLLLRSVKIEEALVAEYTDKVMEIFKKNTVGPQKWVVARSFTSFSHYISYERAV